MLYGTAINRSFEQRFKDTVLANLYGNGDPEQVIQEVIDKE